MMTASRSVGMGFALIAAFLLFGCEKRGAAPAPPVAVANEVWPQISVLTNDLLDGKNPAQVEALEPTRERLNGIWQLKQESSGLSFEFQKQHDFSKSPDGILRMNYGGFGLGGGFFTYDVVFDPAKKRVVIYPLGNVRPDRGHEGEPSGTAILVDENMLAVDAILRTQSDEWKIKTTLRKNSTK